MRETFQAEGEIASLDLLAALCALGREGSTGRVIFTRGPERIVFVIERGVLVDLATPGESSASEVLIRSGKLQRETYEALVIPAGEDRFAVASASGVVSRKEAAWGRKISAIESLAGLLSWTEGSYTFEPLAPESSSGFRLPIDKWILELFLRSNDRAFVMSRIGPTDLPLVKADVFEPAFAALGLTADADAVAALIDGERSVEEIVRKARADEFAVLRLLAALISLGLARPSYEAPFAEEAEARPTREAAEAPAGAPDPRATEPGPFDSATLDSEASRGAAEPLDLPASPPEPISLPLFALTAPEPEPIPEPEPVPEAEPEAPAIPYRRRGRAGIWAALVLAAAGAALVWRLARRPAAPRAPAAKVAERRAPAHPPAAPSRPSPRGEEEPRKSIVTVAPEAAPAKAPERKAGGEPAPWKRSLESNRRAFERPGEFAYAIQLELACEDATVAKALRTDPSGRRIWIVPSNFRGRECYRVLWGKFKTLAKAKDAKSSVPAIFLRGGNRPAVVALGAGKTAGSR